MRITHIDHLRRVLLSSASKYALYSFDLFDTIFARRIEPPELVHRRVAENISRHLGHSISPEDILAHRSVAEHKLRQRAHTQGYDLECAYPDLVGELVHSMIGLRDPQLVEWISDMEMEVEKACLFVKPGMDDLLEELYNRQEKVVIASDMYLSHEQITDLLQAKGIAAYIDAVFVSSQTLRCKYSGKLFADILSSFQIQPEQMVHCGDNKVSDYRAPKRMGIDCIYLREKEEGRRRKLLIKYYYLSRSSDFWKGRYLMQVIGSAPAKAPEKRNDFFYRYGYDALGLIFCTYMLGVLHKIHQEDIQKVFFLARDGFLLQKLFTQFVSRLDGSLGHIPVRYACLTRQSTALASLSNGMGQFQALLPLYNPKQQGLLSILQAYNLVPEEYKAQAVKHGFDRMDEPIHDWNDPRLKAFLDDPQVQSRIQVAARGYKHLLRTYLEQIGFFESDRVGLCDIGWNATIQYFLGSAFAHEPGYPTAHGLYFAYCQGIPYSFTSKDHPEGIFYDETRQLENERVVLSFEELFEESCRALHATTIGYRLKEEKVFPLFKDSRKKDRIAEKANNQIIRKMQQGILDFSHEFIDAVLSTGLKTSELKPFATALAERIVAYPRKEEVKHLQELVHTEDWGYDNVLHVQTSRSTPIKKWKERLWESNWKYGTAASMLGGYVLPVLRYIRIIKMGRL